MFHFSFDGNFFLHKHTSFTKQSWYVKKRDGEDEEEEELEKMGILTEHS